MNDENKSEQDQQLAARQPIFMLPGIITAMVGALLVVHLARTFALNDYGDLALVYWVGFIPLRLLMPGEFDGGWFPLLWTGFTHALLHAGWEHLLLNCAWLAIFGTPVARRYGSIPVVVIFLASALVGAVFFAATTLPELQVLVGASGGIAGLTGAACRFMFQPVIYARHPETGAPIPLGRRTASFGDLARNRQAAFFIVMWLVLNAAVPFLPLLIGQSIGIAWQAHLGGFIAGILMVPLFDRRPGGKSDE